MFVANYMFLCRQETNDVAKNLICTKTVSWLNRGHQITELGHILNFIKVAILNENIAAKVSCLKPPEEEWIATPRWAVCYPLCKTANFGRCNKMKNQTNPHC